MKTPSYLGLLLALVSGFPAFAGRGITVGNGGHTVFCPMTTEYEALDLFEGFVHFRYKYPTSRDTDPFSLALALARKIDAAQGSFARDVRRRLTVAERVRWVAQKMTFTAPGEVLPPTGDTREYQVIPDGCSLIQTIDFRNRNTILVNRDVWQSLDVIDRAALYLHEAVYWYLRDTGVEKDSRRTRRLVAYIMSGGDLTPLTLLPDPPPERGQYCRSSKPNRLGDDFDTKFLAYRNERGEVVLQFEQAGGVQFFDRVFISDKVEGELGDEPIDKGAKIERTMSGLVNFPVDYEAVIQLSWGNGKIKLHGEIQPGNKLDDRIRCEAWP